MTQAEAWDGLYEAMCRHDAAEFERLLDAHPDLRRYDDGRDHWLGEAATEGSLPVIQCLVRRGTDVNEPANNDSVACPEGVVYRAAEMGHLDVVRWLLDQGAEVNFTVEGQTRCYALSGAARGGYLEVVKLLVERGAAVNACWANLTPLITRWRTGGPTSRTTCARPEGNGRANCRRAGPPGPGVPGHRRVRCRKTGKKALGREGCRRQESQDAEQSAAADGGACGLSRVHGFPSPRGCRAEPFGEESPAAILRPR